MLKLLINMLKINIMKKIRFNISSNVLLVLSICFALNLVLAKPEPFKKIFFKNDFFKIVNTFKTVKTENLNSIQIYPNPATTESAIYFSNNTKSTVKLNIYNVLGKKIYSENYTLFNSKKKGVNKINSALQEGVYLLKFFVENSKQTITKRLIIQ